MKKLILIVMLVLGLALVLTPANEAQEVVNFLVSANIPSAQGVSIVASKVNAATDEFFAGAFNALNFDPMSFNSQLGIWLPAVYYAIDVGVINGAGSVDVSVKYTEGAIPQGQTKGLGWKSTATFVKITGPSNNQVETPLAAHGPKKLLTQLTGGQGEPIDDTEIQGGFLRVYVGIFPGDDQSLVNIGGEPFTNADVAGPYDGTLTITATAV